MGRWTKRLGWWAFFALMLAGTAVIALASVEYFTPGRVAPFVIEKLPVRFETLWLWSLKIHVASAIVAFPACLVLMTRALQRRRSLHRWLGRGTGLLMLGAMVPSGVVLAFDAKGGVIVTLGFLLSAAIVVWGLVSGVRAARAGRLVSHAHAMRHVLAQMSVAVTSRAMLIALHIGGMAPEVAYVVALWVPVLASALVVEAMAGPRIFRFVLVSLTPRRIR